jgi:UDPglucose 6-dehydrogenase
MSNISIIGAGYVGLTAAACFAEMGHQVILIDIDTQKLNLLRKGYSRYMSQNSARTLAEQL